MLWEQCSGSQHWPGEQQESLEKPGDDRHTACRSLFLCGSLTVEPQRGGSSACQGGGCSQAWLGNLAWDLELGRDPEEKIAVNSLDKYFRATEDLSVMHILFVLFLFVFS